MKGLQAENSQASGEKDDPPLYLSRELAPKNRVDRKGRQHSTARECKKIEGLIERMFLR